MTSQFHNKLISDFQHLKGKSISGWVGTEMAITEDREGGELWYHPTVPWLQMVVLYFTTDDGSIYRISDYQIDSEFGIFVQLVQEIKPWVPDDTTIYRWIELTCMPTGKINSLDYLLHENGIVSEILFKVGNKQICMRSGEIYEQADGSFQIVWLDESIMTQVDGEHPIIAEHRLQATAKRRA